MQSTHTTSTPTGTAVLVLNTDRLNQLRKANGIGTDLELAKVIGVNHSTLYRVTSGETYPSNGFIAKVARAFPYVSLDDLFSVVTVSVKAQAA